MSNLQLLTNCQQQKPDHESQLRPLVRLTPEQAQQAWESAVENAGGRKITAARVRAAVKQLGLAPATPPVTRVTPQEKAEQRRLIDSTIGDLLMLASQKANHSLMTEKIEALHGYIRAVLPTLSKR